jgi:hypothetical protein
MKRPPQGSNTGRWQAPRMKPVVKKLGEKMQKKPKKTDDAGARTNKPQGVSEDERKRYHLPGPHH